MRGAVAIITRLRTEGRLHPSWKTEEPAALLWELTSFSVWDDLVSESGLAPIATSRSCPAAAGI